jgi:CheY-like chemotaxis protein
LVVEDTPTNRDLLEIVLKKEGYQVSSVSNGQLAVDWVTQQQRTPDLILMDCHMPVMDGLEATRRIRLWEKQTVRLRALPIVALTANAFASDRSQCLAAGMNEFLSKPFYFNDLKMLLQRLLPVAGTTAERALASGAPSLAAEPKAPPACAEGADGRAGEAPPINFTAALDRMEGDLQTFLLFAAALPAQITDDQAMIHQAAQSADAAEALRKASHRLKGVLGMLGAERAQAACLALEIAARQQQDAVYPALVQQLDAALAALSPVLNDFLAHSAEYLPVRTSTHLPSHSPHTNTQGP